MRQVLNKITIDFSHTTEGDFYAIGVGVTDTNGKNEEVIVQGEHGDATSFDLSIDFVLAKIKDEVTRMFHKNHRMVEPLEEKEQ